MVFRLLTRVLVIALLIAGGVPSTARAVEAAKAKAKTPSDRTSLGSNWSLAGSDRLRGEKWDWFRTGSPAVGRESQYTYLGNLLRLDFQRSGKCNSFQLELASSMLVNTPSDGVAAGAQGQLGVGATYHAVNGSRDGTAFVKQLAYLFKEPFGSSSSLKLGRFEFAEGTEALTKEPTMDWIKRERLGQRLLGNFGFTHVGRSFDGVVASKGDGGHTFTGFVARPTVGVFDLDANESISELDVAYGSWTWTDRKHRDARLFYMAYDDDRGTVKVDNRTLVARIQDPADITLHTFGGHLIQTVGRLDLMAWGALQRGDFGRLDQRAFVYDLEAGYRFSDHGWKPWLRVGAYRGSGDDDPSDTTHRTFHQLLPTPRVYARFPFFNGMNSSEEFVQLLLSPNAQTTVRMEFHDLELDEGRDLWYLGGGAFNRTVYGMVGRPSGGSEDLARLIDLDVTWKASPKVSFTLYAARAFGGAVVKNIYPIDSDASFSYAEVTRKF